MNLWLKRGESVSKKKQKNSQEMFSNIHVYPTCPECGSEDYMRDNYESEGDEVWFPCRCQNCNATFDEIFRFSHVLGNRMIKGKLVDGK